MMRYLAIIMLMNASMSVMAMEDGKNGQDRHRPIPSAHTAHIQSTKGAAGSLIERLRSSGQGQGLSATKITIMLAASMTVAPVITAVATQNAAAGFAVAGVQAVGFAAFIALTDDQARHDFFGC